MRFGVIYGLLAAVLFGASTPVAKILVVHINPVMLAGLLYFSIFPTFTIDTPIRDEEESDLKLTN